MDHLRVFLTAMVVVHHCMYQLVTARAVDSWGLGYKWEMHPDRGTMANIEVVLRFNQAHFMGLFFFLAGYFVQPSYEQKGLAKYLQDRSLRLLVPLIFYELLLSPVIFSVAQGVAAPGAPQGLVGAPSVFRWYFNRYLGVGHNPMWFVTWLYIFDVTFLISRCCPARCGGVAVRAEHSVACTFTSTVAPRPFSIRFMLMMSGVLTGVMGTVVLAIRCVWGDNWNVHVICFQPSFLVGQYIIAYILGLAARRVNALAAIPKQMGYWSLTVGLMWFMIPLGLEWGYHDIRGVNLQRDLYYLYQVVISYQEMGTGVLWSMGLMVVAREHWNWEPGVAGRQVVGATYGTYILHPFFIVLFTRSLLGWDLPPVRFLVVLSELVLPSTWVVAVVLRQIPGARRIL